MGVPKFYRWISERYPCLSEVIKEFQIPEFDNLYLDMNGIIHVCSHPEDDNPHFRISEEDIFICIFHYIEFLFRMIKPRKVFFMAVDGVAPRAKMNQQRGRRFRSAREAENLIQQAKDRGEVLPTEKRFDSNCITPGTQFMVKLQTQLQYFVVQKISSDPLWQGVDIYLSGHETPGEGEHKIMDFIRYARSKPNYDPNTRHCLYGLDADLIMLGLTTHEPHFSLLREEVRFGGKKDKNKRPQTPEETTFLLLHLSLLREYLGFEFADLEHRLSFPYDLERIIDDWILMSFLVGNDFIPHLPHLHIHHDGLPTLWQTYMQVLPTCDGYLTDGGHLNLPRFQKYIAALSELDLHKFQEASADVKWLSAKSTRGRPCRPKTDLTQSPQKGEIKWRNLEKFELDDTDVLLEGLEENLVKSPEFETPQNLPISSNCSEEQEFTKFKKDYYMTKLEYKEVTPEVLRHQAETYVTALQWILLYYFEGCQSWSWYYPHHYAPFMSDIVNIKDLKIKFNMGKPFLPFQQLMAVLPAASKEFLPIPFQELMISESSPLKEYYPEDFKTDLNGKMQEWEAVVLIPFIDESLLIDCMKAAEHRLLSEESKRNKHGPCLLYQYVPLSQGIYPSTMPKRFPDLSHHYSKCTYIAVDEFHVNPSSLKKGLLANEKTHVYYPGFPTLKHIRHRAELKRDGVKVFQSNSRGENMIIQIIDESEQDLKSIAMDLLGKNIYVDWPHLYEARVVRVSDDLTRYLVSNVSSSSLNPKCEKSLEHDQTIWHREVNAVADKYHSRRGIDIGPTFALIHACPMTGRRYVAGSHGKITLEKQFSEIPQTFVLQACVKDIVMEESSLCQYKTIDELFTPDAPVFIIGWPHYGCEGKVFQIEKSATTKIHVGINLPHEPNLDRIIHNQQSFKKRYSPAYIACQRLGIGTHFLSRITGTVFVQRGSRQNPSDQKSNIGLNLKFSKRNEEVPGYTRRTEDGWLYSDKAVDVVLQYLQRFPDMWEYISSQDHNGADIYFEADVFSRQKDTLQDVINFLKSLPCQNIKPQKVGCEVLDEGIIQAIQSEVHRVQDLSKNNPIKKDLSVVPQHLFRPFPLVSNLIPDPEVKFQLFDRIVNVRQGFTVPFGLRGTLVGIHPGEKQSENIYDVVFDEAFPNGIDFGCSPRQGYRLLATAMINLSFGQRKFELGPVVSSPFQPRMSYQAGRHQESSKQSTASERRFQQSQYFQDRQAQIQRQSGGANRQDDTFHLNSCHDVSTPHFVTPKIFNRQQSNPKISSDKSLKLEKSGVRNNNEFTDMWKELQQHTNEMIKLHPSPHSTNKKTTSDWSLTKAAQALDKLPNPSSRNTPPRKGEKERENEEECSRNNNCSNNREHRNIINRGGGGGGGSRDLASASSQRGTKSRDGSQAAAVAAPQGGVANMTRLNLDNLFGQAVKRDLQAVTNSLEDLKVANEDDDGAAVKETKPPLQASGSAEAGTAALRHMLHIGESEFNKCRGWYGTADPNTLSPQPKQPAPQHSQVQQQQQQKLSSSSSSLSSSSSSSSSSQSHSLDTKSNDLSTTAVSSSLTTASSMSSFTRQVTVEELFEACRKFSKTRAKDQVLSQANLASTPRGQSASHTLQQQPHPHQQQHPAYVNVSAANHPLLQARTVVAAVAHKQLQQQHQRHRGPPPGFPKHQNPKSYNSKVNVRRSSVTDLYKWCCQSGIGAPKYDYSGTKNHITARVTLPNGVRFQGSVCPTREEAAESAASMALLPATSLMLPYPFVPPPPPPPPPHAGLIPAAAAAAQLGQLPQQFPSPNSAFSPVVPRGPTPGWSLVSHPPAPPPAQHLQKISWYAPATNLPATVTPVVSHATYQTSSTNSPFGTKQQLIGNTLVSTMTPTQALCKVSASLNRPIANGNSNSSQTVPTSQSSSSSSKVISSSEHSTNKLSENKFPPGHSQGEDPKAATQLLLPDPSPAPSNSSLSPLREAQPKSNTAPTDKSQSDQKPVQDPNPNLDPKPNPTDLSNASKKAETNSGKGHRKKGRSRIAANFGVAPTPNSTN